MTSQLILEHSKHLPRVVIDRKCSSKLGSTEKNLVRFAFKNYTNQQNGIVLNVLHTTLRYQLACSVALDALDKASNSRLHILVICSESNLKSWEEYLRNCTQRQVYKLSGKLGGDPRNWESSIFILTVNEIRNHKGFVKNLQYFCVVVDDIDENISKQLVGQIKGSFHIGITHKNFITQRNQNIQWKIINWTIGKRFKKLEEFQEYDNAYFLQRVDPYDDFWFIFDETT